MNKPVENMAHNAWVNAIHDLVQYGEPSDPRGHDTLEILGFTTQFDMRAPVVTSRLRKVSYKFMFREAWWILTGRNDLSSIVVANPRMADYSDDGHFMRGAYGPQIVEQLPWVVAKLNEDNDSRQAVMSIWRQRPGPSKDIPCTLSIQFLWRKDTLHLVVNMRSSDAWLGLPYDWFNFSCLGAYVSMFLEPRPKLGSLFWQAGSQHIYMKHVEMVDLWVKNAWLESDSYPGFLQTYRFETPRSFTEWLYNKSELFIHGDREVLLEGGIMT